MFWSSTLATGTLVSAHCAGARKGVPAPLAVCTRHLSPRHHRSSSKIFLAEKNIISNFSKLYEHLNSDDVLIINNTKVVPAIILGENSYGKGSVQSIIPLKNKGAIRLTVAKYYLPSGKSISEVGVSPDIEVEEETDEFRIKTDTDNQLSYAIKLLNG
mgnify:CR=1 FL=1